MRAVQPEVLLTLLVGLKTAGYSPPRQVQQVACLLGRARNPESLTLVLVPGRGPSFKPFKPPTTPFLSSSCPHGMVRLPACDPGKLLGLRIGLSAPLTIAPLRCVLASRAVLYVDSALHLRLSQWTVAGRGHNQRGWPNRPQLRQLCGGGSNSLSDGSGFSPSRKAPLRFTGRVCLSEVSSFAGPAPQLSAPGARNGGPVVVGERSIPMCIAS